MRDHSPLSLAGSESASKVNAVRRFYSYSPDFGAQYIQKERLNLAAREMLRDLRNRKAAFQKR